MGPAFGRELGELSMGMGGDAEEHVLQVREGRHVDQFAALDQRVEHGGAVRASHTAGEEPILATDRDHAQLILGSGMPPARLCRALRMRSWIDPISAPTIVADAA